VFKLDALFISRSIDFAFSVAKSSYDSLTDICTSDSNGLSSEQKGECSLQPDAALAIAEGVFDGLTECSRQFTHRRWNCSYTSQELFKNGLKKSESEMAWLYFNVLFDL